MGEQKRPRGRPRLTAEETNIAGFYDGYRWKNCNQGIIKGNPNPRTYYKCKCTDCPARKHVQRASHDSELVIATIVGKHNHDVPTSRTMIHDVQGPTPINATFGTRLEIRYAADCEPNPSNRMDEDAVADADADGDDDDDYVVHDENISTAHDLNVKETMNPGVHQVRIESSMNPVFGNKKGRGVGDAATERTLVNVDGYKVKQEVAPLLRGILAKHGDIGRNCKTRCPEARGRLVVMIYSVYQKLEETNLTYVSEERLEGMLENLNVLRIQNFDVNWLTERIEDILKTRNMLEEHRLMKVEVEKKIVAVVEKKAEITGYRKRLSDAEAELQLMNADLEKVERKAKDLEERGNAYLNKSLADGLV